MQTVISYQKNISAFLLIIAIFLSTFFVNTVWAQENVLTKPITLQLTNVTLAEALSAVGKEAGAPISYSSSQFDTQRRVSIAASGTPLSEVLAELLGKDFNKLLVEGNRITIQASSGKGKVTGTVQTADGKPAAYVTVGIQGYRNTRTDEQGHFSLEGVEAGAHQLNASAVGYSTATQEITVAPDQTADITFTLQQTGQLSEVIVTASRVQESIDEVPSSVTILNAAQIEQQANINNSISEILGFTVPGLGPSTNKATNSGQTLRGRSVLVLIDGIPQSTPLMNGSRDIRSIDPAIIERVEIIKGATSIYGNGSGGGIINYITKKPDGDKKISGQTTLGTNGQPGHLANTMGYRISQVLHGTIDQFSYVAGGSYNYNGVFKDAEGNVLAQDDGLSQTYSYNIFAKAAYQFNASSNLTLSYSTFHSLQETDYINQSGVYGERPSIGIKGEYPGDPAGTPQNHNAFLTYRNEALPLNTFLELTGYYQRFLSTNRYVERANGWYGPGQTQISSKKKGVRLNLSTPWGNGIVKGNVVYGVDLLGDVTSQPLLDGRIYIPNMDMTNFAPYAQLKADIAEYLIFKGGIRYENATVKIADFNTLATGPNGEGSIPVTGATLSYNATIFNAGLRYTKFDAFNPFVSFSQGFGLNELGRIVRSAEESTLTQLQTDPIITNNYEVGVSSRFSLLHLTAAYYISTSKLGANLVDRGDGYMVPQRAPERVYGYELTADAYLLPNLTVGATYAYVEGKAELENGTKQYLTGSRIAPPKATAYVYYAPVDRLNLQLFWVYTGDRDRFNPLDNGTYRSSEGPTKAVNLFNLNASYRFSQALRASLGVENLFNNAYFPYYSQYSALNEQYYMGNGAKTSLSISYSF
ncbi:TonB-dependent receptor [Parapedobacter koreensis]|uniref:Iron complex outermembrane recepter protein n=1 Tax=Parapedobacter koreensis TaxID=332977 RepID=A0A1H7JWG0_9SPHI|nr:TonB-dependent receptor [Parapedobacter koreensis]SEK78923.1 iron complex outermembrane recepter protein [Parapedobacter koreensis]